MTQREQEIYQLIRENPMVSQQEIADRLGIQRSSVAVHISNLIKKGWIAGKGYILNTGDYVVVIGGATMDLMGFSDRDFLEGESNPGRTLLSPGGVGRNIAENLARLGLEVHLMTAVGQDLYGQQLLERCREAGIDTRATLKIPGASTSLYLAMIEPDGEMKLALSSMAVMDQLDVEALRREDALLSGAAAIIADTNLPEKTLTYLMSQYRHIPIYVDPVSAPKSERLKGALEGIDTLKPNQKELEALTGMKTDTLDAAKKAAKVLCENGIRRVVVSIGAQGALYATRETVQFFRSLPVKSANATGAGDAFMAGLIYSAISKLDDRSAMDCAMSMAELTLESADAIAQNLNENLLLNRLNAHKIEDRL
ncbi:PfkB family carbohydrate kinase [Acidaminobacter sp.]|uniref:PfkB family carbohydrate kinase n=1 Tax=Acidaminobacter sp. TaxID=1872102 RepID=UPI00137ECF43|nr:PfkB family carbohydrate kinase [Acidaminobacter sp.]MDK9710888.1 PfkB family carbohydrate kinase [Acidaminobacter sp.]MZQ98351.1 winged helix-turn-helix transcriptional regulator [Acidaminobacter sp.]